MNVLVACEESQRVCIAFRERGHRAFSCDIIPCSGGRPEWHIQADVLPILDGVCEFTTMDGTRHKLTGQWDLIIAHPPCTFLSVAGNRYFNAERYGEKALLRAIKRLYSAEFFMQFVNANCAKIAIENPVGWMNTHYRRPDQIVHPYFFGDPALKRTCLWLKGLPLLRPTNPIEKPAPLYYRNGKAIHFTEGIRGTHAGQEGRARERSKTFPGIARAMAEQWGNPIK